MELAGRGYPGCPPEGSRFSRRPEPGGYITASAFYGPPEWDIEYFDSLGMDTTDLPALLEVLCAKGSQPCLPIGDILYLGIDYRFGYTLIVRFTDLDGSIIVDPSGESTYYINISIDADGKVGVSLPSYLYPPEK